MTFKYQSELAAISQSGSTCPPQTAHEANLTAWRWVFSPISEAHFLPQARKHPVRLNKAKDVEEKCSCWGISMHDTREKSITAFKRVECSFRKARKVLGTHVAKAKITPDHGVCTPSNEVGHFDFHPYKNIKMSDSFFIDGPIP
jgi:hypothetical protein